MENSGNGDPAVDPVDPDSSKGAVPVSPDNQPGKRGRSSRAADDGIGVATIGVLPKVLWFGLAVAGLYVFAQPAIRLLNEESVSKVAVGIFEIDLAQKAVANIANTFEQLERLQTRQQGEPPKEGIPVTADQFKPIAERAQRMAKKLRGAFVLWVDNKNPFQNVEERRALESLGIHFDLAGSTAEAIRWLDSARYDGVISNINRPNESTNDIPCFSDPEPAGAGCAMAKTMHERYGDHMPPTIFYSGRFPQSAGSPPFSFGVTNRVDQLFELVFDALERRKVDEAAP